jgi:hypothetical protein
MNRALFALLASVVVSSTLAESPNAVGNAIGYAIHYSRSYDAVIRVYDDGGNAIETHEHKGDFRDW